MLTGTGLYEGGIQPLPYEDDPELRRRGGYPRPIIALETRTYRDHRGVPKPPRSTRTYGLHRGVPGLILCRPGPTGSALRPAQCHAGQPSRWIAPVQLFRLRRRPPACHRRGRSPSNTRRATTPMGRRWAATGGPEGRGSRKPSNANPAPNTGACHDLSDMRFKPPPD